MFANINGKEISEYYGKPYVEISSNPIFLENEKKNKFPAKYNKLGSFKISGEEYPIYSVCACIDMEHVSQGKYNGNKNKKMPDFFKAKYDFIKGKYLFNNCHLIGYQLSADKSKENLVIGTRYMNEIGMLKFENEVAEYVRATGNYVLYRVTPIFNENEQLIRGVQMEALSLEDKEICFNVFVYNVQPGVFINYANGDSKQVDEWCSKMFTRNNMYTIEEKGTQDYILNTYTNKFHKPGCNCVDNINENNKKDFKWPMQFLKDNGCKPCGSCRP